MKTRWTVSRYQLLEVVTLNSDNSVEMLLIRTIRRYYYSMCKIF